MCQKPFIIDSHWFTAIPILGREFPLALVIKSRLPGCTVFSWRFLYSWCHLTQAKRDSHSLSKALRDQSCVISYSPAHPVHAFGRTRSSALPRYVLSHGALADNFFFDLTNRDISWGFWDERPSSCDARARAKKRAWLSLEEKLRVSGRGGSTDTEESWLMRRVQGVEPRAPGSARRSDCRVFITARGDNVITSSFVSLELIKRSAIAPCTPEWGKSNRCMMRGTAPRTCWSSSAVALLLHRELSDLHMRSSTTGFSLARQ